MIFQPLCPAPLPEPSLPFYSARDGAEYAERLHTALQNAGLRPWLDARDTPAGYDPYALRECASADIKSESAREWQKALQYKKPIIHLRFAPGAARPLQLGNRPILDFTGSFDPALTGLRQSLADLSSPTGQLRELEYRKADAEGELRYATGEQRPRILADIERLEGDILLQREVVRDPQAATLRAEQCTEAALERERRVSGRPRHQERSWRGGLRHAVVESVGGGAQVLGIGLRSEETGFLPCKMSCWKRGVCKTVCRFEKKNPVSALPGVETPRV
jgi:hypothetical protein